ncbi:MAG: RNA 3'-terminal phosphate cyclase [Planctomycetes bacterium]|nr:RNA 3'-terminal phosphate cyclase [Planctomycetota bacterium]MCB9886305.1 RNA 3'-terminal phosphate cyclase [Planctomycetota bacterium]
MITIDGSSGEGGGQVLRTAIGLSLVTGEKCVVENVRAGRKKPGLQRQHLTAVLAAAEVGDARVEGAELGSSRVAFVPKAVRAGDYTFAIGTAGSTTLVLQTVLPALLSASGPSTVSLEGGTHNPMAPPYDFLAETFAPLLHRMGAGLALQLHRHGFYPAGGGRVSASIAPAAWTPLELLERRDAPEVRARIVVARIPPRVAPREASMLRSRLGLRNDEIVIDEVESAGPGNVVILRLQLGEVTEVITQLGERGVLAETVASRAAAEAIRLLAANVPVGEHLADQLLIPMALAGGGAFRTVAPSEHTRTNAAVIERFLPVAIAFHEDGQDGAWRVEVRAR